MANNPAGRLLEILEYGNLTATNNDRMASVWDRISDRYVFQESAPNKIYYFLNHVASLIRQGKEQVMLLGNVKVDLYMSPFDKLNERISPQYFTESWENFKNALGTETFTSLHFCSDAMSKLGLEEDIDLKTIHDLRSQVENLLGMIHASDLPEYLRAALVAQMEEIRRALFEYEMQGASGLRRALELSAGSLLRYGDDIKEIDEGKEGKQIIKELVSILRELDRIVAFASKVIELTPIFKMLSSGGNS